MAISKEEREALKNEILQELQTNKLPQRDFQWFGAVYDKFLFTRNRWKDRKPVDPLGVYFDFHYCYKFAEALRGLVKCIYKTGYLDQIKDKEQALRIANRICESIIKIMRDEGILKKAAK